VQASYKTLDHQMLLASNNHLVFEVVDPSNTVILRREGSNEGFGHVGWTSAVGGEHQLCLFVTDAPVQPISHTAPVPVSGGGNAPPSTPTPPQPPQPHVQHGQVVSSQGRSFRVELAVDYGEATTDYTEIAQHEHLSAIEVEIRKLNDKVRGVRAEQNYQKSREEEFRNTSESTNSRVMWYSIAETAVLLISGYWQINRLKSFFRQKKLA